MAIRPTRAGDSQRTGDIFADVLTMRNAVTAAMPDIIMFARGSGHQCILSDGGRSQ